MKQGQTVHHPTCECDFCRLGETLNPTRCQATFKEHCQYPKCDCDRLMKAKREEYLTAEINSTEFPRLERILAAGRSERLAELEEKLAGKYVGGMTEYWQRCKDFLLSEKGQEIADVLDGPEQECYPLCQKGMTKDTCPYNPNLGCDCGANPANEFNSFSDEDIFDPPLTREELEYARDYAQRINTELRTYDAHEHPKECRCEVCRHWGA